MAYALRRKCSVYLPPKAAAKLDIKIKDDDSFIAFTDGSCITLGARFREVFKNDSVKRNRQFIFYCGICAHELAHLLYTRFDLRRRMILHPDQFVKGQPFEQESLQNLSIPAYLAWVAQLQNIFEDSYIEWRFKEHWGGGFLSNCMIWTRYFIYDHDKVDEDQITQFSPYNTIHNFLLDFCIFQKENYSFLTDEQKGWIKGALQILQPVLHQTVRQNGKASFLTAFKMANYILSLYPQMPSSQQMESESESCQDYSRDATTSDTFQKEAQQDSKQQKPSAEDPNLSKQFKKAVKQLEQAKDDNKQQNKQDSSPSSEKEEEKESTGDESNKDATSSEDSENHDEQKATDQDVSPSENNSADSDDDESTDTEDKSEANPDGDTDDSSPDEADMATLLSLLESGVADDLEQASEELRREDLNHGVWENDAPECMLSDLVDSKLHLVIRQEILPVAKILARSYIAKFRKAQTPSARCYDKGKFRPKFAVQTDMMYFDGRTVKNAPTKIALQLLLDGSGSMNGGRDFQVTKVAILLAEFCKEVGIPVSVYWHSCNYHTGTVNIFQQKEFTDTGIEGICVHDCYGSNRDGQAIRFAARNLAKRSEQHKILLLLSDGQPSAYRSNEEASEDIAYSLNFCKRKKIDFIAGAFADDKDALKELYGEKYLDIPSIEQFGPNFINRLKKLIK